MSEKQKKIVAGLVAALGVSFAIAYATTACIQNGCPPNYKKVFAVCVPC